ncbi:hypothetical protein C7M84_016171 [Penaeus vannamei]|uniref:Uncharacterized protein n=1 Tax=Penaeus vannamei TaxID=6689 RepID=A0A3R7QZZ6_PENVA|nr:hypothetical protein C7M84_016171 [Penaeus vannamei]
MRDKPQARLSMSGSATVSGQEGTVAGGGRWVRPAGNAETFFDAFQTRGMFVTAYWVTLRSAEPLQEASVGLALRHLFRKVPPLRTCFRRQGDCLWLCEMEEEAVDFQVEEEADPRRVMEDLMSQSFASHDGPLWRARLVRGAAGEDCPLEEVRASSLTRATSSSGTITASPTEPPTSGPTTSCSGSSMTSSPVDLSTTRSSWARW